MNQMEVDSVTRMRVWTPETDKLLRRWKMQIEKRERGHRFLSNIYKRRNYMVTVPLILLTASVTTISGVGAIFGAVPLWITITSASLSGLATVCSSVQSLMDYSETSVENKKAADNYESLYREIEILQDVPGPLRGDPIVVLKDLRNRYDEVMKKSPSLPEKYSPILSYDTVSDRLKQSSSILPPSPSDITINVNGRDEEDLEALKKVLDDSDGKSLKDILQAENDYDTGDDEKEVCLPFDIDSAHSYSTYSAAISAAKLTAGREARAQRSLQTALRYEMQRLENQHSSSGGPKIVSNSDSSL